MKSVLQNPIRIVLNPNTTTAAVATSARTSSNLDTSGFRHVTFLTTIGAVAGTNADPVSVQVYSSNDTVASNFATVAAAKTVQPNSSGVVVFQHIDLKGQKGRYYNVVVTPGTATLTSATNADGVQSSTIAIMGEPEQTPILNSLLADAVQIVVGGAVQ